jgi:hypothetical protein
MMTTNAGFRIAKPNQVDIASNNRKSRQIDPTIVLTNLPEGTHSEYKQSSSRLQSMRKVPKISLAVCYDFSAKTKNSIDNIPLQFIVFLQRIIPCLSSALS